MRPFRQDLTGTTDANGNATITVKMPQTGEWHNLKFSLSTSGQAEWAVTVSGTAVTYGRGRRVTLGPELIQDNEQVSIAVTSGPPKATIIGAATGVSGQPPEMLFTFAPQPNTISLDQSSQQSLLQGPVNMLSGATVTLPPLPIGTTYVRLVFFPNTPLQAELRGNTVNSPSYYLENVAPNVAGIIRNVEVDPNVDSVLQFINHGAGTLNNLQVIAHTDPVPPDVVSQISPQNPPLFASNSAIIKTAPGLATDFTIITGQAGKRIYLHDVILNTNSGTTWEVSFWDGSSAGGNQVAEFFQVMVTQVGNSPPVNWDGKGRTLTIANNLVGRLDTGAGGSTIFGTVGFTQV